MCFRYCALTFHVIVPGIELPNPREWWRIMPLGREEGVDTFLWALDLRPGQVDVLWVVDLRPELGRENFLSVREGI